MSLPRNAIGNNLEMRRESISWLASPHQDAPGADIENWDPILGT